MWSRGRWCGPVITRTSRRTLRRDNPSLVAGRWSLGSSFRQSFLFNLTSVADGPPQRARRFAVRKFGRKDFLSDNPRESAVRRASPVGAFELSPALQRWEE